MPTTLDAVTLALLGAFRLNGYIFVGTLVIAVPLGLVISFGSMSRFGPLRWLTKTFVWAIRGTPLMLQIMIAFFAPPLLFGVVLPRTETAIIAFGINYAAYFSEIYRGGIESIPRGQLEAGQVLGMTRSQIFRKIVLLQVIKRITPPMGNEIITLIKDTCLARVIAIMEINMKAQQFASKGLIWPLFFSGVFFLVFVAGLTVLFHYFEKKLSYFR
ncbi:MAG: amino acid ABC transporter permease [Christensenellales bacterium]|jgi:polar amino acid transport system permease protein